MIKRFFGNVTRAITRLKLLRGDFRHQKIETQLTAILSKAKNLEAYESKLQNFDPENTDFDVISFFRTLPILSKKDLKDNPSSFMFKDVNYHEVRTGGSTGEPLVFFQDKNSRNAQKRNMYFGRKQWGLNFNEDRCTLLWGHSNSFAPGLKGSFQKLLVYIKDFLLDRNRVSVYELSSKSVGNIVESINKHDPHYIQGYASSLETLASIIADSGLKLKLKNLKLIVSTAEPLLDSHKVVIENTFNCKVANEYGCTEVGVLAYSQPEGGMQTAQENIFIEFINIFNEESSIFGEILVSTLGYSSPIILRYKTGDLAKLIKQNDGSYQISSVVGRNHDSIKLVDGSIIHGELFTHVLENIDSIEKFQVHQTKLTQIDINLKTNKNWLDSHSNLIKMRLNTVLNDRAEINILFNELLLENSGKFRWIKSDV